MSTHRTGAYRANPSADKDRLAGEEFQRCHALISQLREQLGLDAGFEGGSPSARLEKLIRDAKKEGVRRPVLF